MRLLPPTLERSALMARIRSKRTKPEMETFRAARVAGLRFRRWCRAHGADLCLHRERLAVFVHGCFWHGCRRHFRRPVRNRAFWEAKIVGNMARDRRRERGLRALGWRVLVRWEHEPLWAFMRRLRRKAAA